MTRRVVVSNSENTFQFFLFESCALLVGLSEAAFESPALYFKTLHKCPAFVTVIIFT